MAQYIKTYQKPLKDIEIHSLAELTPLMTEESYRGLKDSIADNGQEVPIVMYKGKVVDGRHRVMALKELGEETVTAVNEPASMSEEEVRNKVLNVYENRRHQSSTQRAIIAYRMYVRQKNIDEKTTKSAIAQSCGIARPVMYRAEKLAKYAPEKILDMLFNGKKINIGTQHSPIFTDNLSTLVNHFEKYADTIVEQSEEQPVAKDLTDEEIVKADRVVSTLSAEYSGRVIDEIVRKLYRLRRVDNE